MTSTDPEHDWTREQMAAALAHGLDAAERARFDAHLSACATCAADFAEMTRREADLVGLFADARPAAGFEDRLIQSLRATNPRRPWVHPTVRRAAIGVAATLLLASAGYVVTAASDGGKLPDLYAIGQRVRAASSLREAGRELLLPAKEASTQYGLAMTSAESAAPESGTEWDLTRGVYLGDGAEADATNRWSKDFRYNYQPPTSKSPGSASVFKSGETVAGRGGEARPSLNAGDKPAKPAAPGQQSQPSWKEDAGKRTVNDYYARTDAKPTGDVQFDDGHVAEHQLGRAGTPIIPFKPADLAKAGREAAAPDESKNPNFALEMPQLLQRGSGGGGGEQSLFGGMQVTQATPTPTPPPQTPAPAQPPLQPVASAAPAAPAPTRKVIRTGAMEFEVDRFDAALAMVTKLAQENGGYVGTTDSEKLPNGKVKGTVVVRVPPDRLDTLVTQLRGIGDLRSQKMDAQDVTKQYTDLEGELRAARAMEERLLEIIKTGKGEIKDLLAAEKELGVWRTKIEKMVGEMRYYDNLVSLTTLTITAFERDIRTAATAKETETVNAGIETDDVEAARAAALKAIEEAKGRVIQSDLKRYDAGQFAAQVVAEVSPDAAGALVDRLKQLGKVARLEVQRRQTTPEGTTQPAAGARLERAETRINLSLYNLANVAPRQTTNLNLAAADVEAAYKAIAARVEKAGGRVVTSSLTRPQAEQVVGSIHFEVKSPDAEAVLTDVRALGEPMRLTVTENPDTNNVTTAKQGFVVQLVSVATVPVRESTNLQIAAADVAAAYNALRDAVRATPARVTTSELNEAVRENVTAVIDFEVMRTDLPAIEDAIRQLGDVTQRTSGRSGDTENTVDSKVRVQVSFVDADQLPPRETTALAVETTDPDKALADVQSLAAGAGGRVIESNLSQERGGETIGKLVVDVPLAKSVELITRAKGQGSVRMVQSTKNAKGVEGSLARARVDMTFTTGAGIVGPGQGLWASVRRGLAASMTGLMWSLQLIIIGLCFVGPWVLVIGLLWKLFKRRRTSPVAATA